MKYYYFEKHPFKKGKLWNIQMKIFLENFSSNKNVRKFTMKFCEILKHFALKLTIKYPLRILKIQSNISFAVFIIATVMSVVASSCLHQNNVDPVPQLNKEHFPNSHSAVLCNVNVFIQFSAMKNLL
jgi:hypothetical protein